MKMQFKTEKHAREETIGRAATMAEVAVREQRDFNERESRKVAALLAVAESLGLESGLPRTPRELLAFARKSSETPLTVAAVVGNDPKLKPPKGKKR